MSLARALVLTLAAWALAAGLTAAVVLAIGEGAVR
jgi:hypothetical protein